MSTRSPPLRSVLFALVLLAALSLAGSGAQSQAAHDPFPVGKSTVKQDRVPAQSMA